MTRFVGFLCRFKSIIDGVRKHFARWCVYLHSFGFGKPKTGKLLTKLHCGDVFYFHYCKVFYWRILDELLLSVNLEAYYILCQLTTLAYNTCLPCSCTSFVSMKT